MQAENVQGNINNNKINRTENIKRRGLEEVAEAGEFLECESSSVLGIFFSLRVLALAGTPSYGPTGGCLGSYCHRV